MAYAALVSLSELLGHTMHHRHKYFYVPHGDDRQKLESIHENSRFLQSFLDDNPHKGGEAVQALEAEIRDAAYRAQDIIEWHISNHIDSIHEDREVKKQQQLGTQNSYYKEELLEAFDLFGLTVEEAKNFRMSCSVEEMQIGSTRTPALASLSRARSGGNRMVGYEEEFVGIQERLCGGSTKLKIIPFVGMGGIGKTILARNIFDDSLIAYHFHTRAWATISQQQRLQGTLVGILHSLTLKTEELQGEVQRSYLPETSDESLIESVYRSLIGKRYLIVLDDMWSREAWDELRLIFPDNNNGSRIIVTTRLRDVAEYASSFSPNIHQMHHLNGDESWKLLREKVFGEESCPPELEETGKTVARNCGGLPLAILVIAGILMEIAMTEYHWKIVAENVSAVVANADGNFSKILSLSYDHLPNHLKACFLYMGAFSEAYEIPVSDLIKLWVAEGFLKPIESKTLEEAAEVYLEDLVKRNLVMMSVKTWTGRYKFCGMHDLLRDLCVQKAEEEKFLAVADRNVNSRGTNIAISRRLAICFGMVVNVSNELLVRSILQFNFIREASSLLSCSRLLRVLNMPNAWLGSFSDEITGLFHLRYLAFDYTNMLKEPLVLPSTVSKLQNLQTLIIRRYDFVDSKTPVPLDIWELPLLRHVILKRSLLLIPPPPRNCPVLENLQTVSKVMNFKFTRRAISMIPNVKKLKLVYDNWSMLSLKKVVHFHQLETLKLDLYHTGIARVFDATDASKISVPFPVHYTLPTSLKRLSLRGCRPPSEDMSIIGSLPNLEVLKLKGFDFVDRCWETKEGGFTRLRFLKIDWSNVITWRTESRHLPRLEHLIIRCCWVLEEIPCEIGEVGTLKVIEVDTCSQTAADSALSIQEEQESMGNEELVVTILKDS